jgi:hypothetical protein
MQVSKPWLTAAVGAGCWLSAVSFAHAQAATNYPAYTRDDIGISYRVDDKWPQKPAGAEWGAVAGIAVDPQGLVWVFSRGTSPIQAYRADGTFVRQWGAGSFKNAHQIRFDKEGNLWAVDNGFNTVTKWTPEGKLLLTLGTKDEQGVDDTHFNQPTDIAFAPNGDLFVSDGYVNSRIVHFDRNGKFKKAWGKLGTGPGEFSVPHGVAFDSRGRLYVTDRNNGRVQVFDQNGKFLSEWQHHSAVGDLDCAERRDLRLRFYAVSLVGEPEGRVQRRAAEGSGRHAIRSGRTREGPVGVSERHGQAGRARMGPQRGG